MRYIYESISLKYSSMRGRAKEDYLDIINEKGSQGWRFVCFSPLQAKPKGVKGIELVFEKVLQ